MFGIIESFIAGIIALIAILVALVFLFMVFSVIASAPLLFLMIFGCIFLLIYGSISGFAYWQAKKTQSESNGWCPVLQEEIAREQAEDAAKEKEWNGL
ncbi:hypothetical protein [Neisseria montereyensis]|uniref:Uncharacterized protein n=1 Tax=Neisseria montereyensis TaxID=2973938 RepID=A0ABT2F9A8_9NEIS|nr:hypothetical protein [Neisseria montereyensis]MCS4532737.1 hypothetical protein [Neisseria montereyensis]